MKEQSFAAPDVKVHRAQGSAAFVFGQRREDLGLRFVYAVVSQRARGLSIGINLTPNRQCNFDCVYCEVDHSATVRDREVNLDVLGRELDEVLAQVREKRLALRHGFRTLPAEWLELKEVALSGDGEPTLCPRFCEVVETVISRRAKEPRPFKLVLITNTCGLGKPSVRRGLKHFQRWDEIWVKLDVGTQADLDRVNRAGISLRQLYARILRLARQRPVVIQSLFPQIRGCGPSERSVAAYLRCLRQLERAGAQVSLVQVYSAHRPPHRPECAHVPLATLSEIARRVRETTGFKAEVF